MNKLVEEIIKPLLNEAGEKYFWPETILPKIKGTGYDTSKLARNTLLKIKSLKFLEKSKLKPF